MCKDTALGSVRKEIPKSLHLSKHLAFLEHPEICQNWLNYGFSARALDGFCDLWKSLRAP